MKALIKNKQLNDRILSDTDIDFTTIKSDLTRLPIVIEIVKKIAMYIALSSNKLLIGLSI